MRFIVVLRSILNKRSPLPHSRLFQRLITRRQQRPERVAVAVGQEYICGDEKDRDRQPCSVQKQMDEEYIDDDGRQDNQRKRDERAAD